jgi:hypothetical protein
VPKLVTVGTKKPKLKKPPPPPQTPALSQAGTAPTAPH